MTIATSVPTRTGADTLVDRLIAHEIDVVFGLPGLQLDPLFDALHRGSGAVRTIHTRHEQGAAYMADGYARASGRIGCCAVVPGPGLLNAGAGLATATACSSPVLAIVADIPSVDRGRTRGVLHEIPGQAAVLRSVTRHCIEVSSPNLIGPGLDMAVRAIRTGPTGPAGIHVPADFLAMQTGAETSIAPQPTLEAETAGLVRIAEMIRASSRIVIVAGGGVPASQSEPLVAELARELGAPVIMSRNARGTIDDDEPLAFTSVATPALVGAADLIIALGSKLLHVASVIGQSAPSRRPAIVQIDADPLALGRGTPIQAGHAGDMQPALRMLMRLVRGHRTDPEWESECARIRMRLRLALAELEPQSSLAGAIRAALPPESIVVSGMTQLGYWANVGLPVHRPHTLLSSGYQGTLGFEYATALGAKVAAPESPVVALVGDGGFLYTATELATAVQHNIGVIAIVFNDGAYGNVRRIQAEQYEGRFVASQLVNPDFVAFARSFGAHGYRVDGPEALQSTLAGVVRDGGPTVIEVPVGPMRDVRAVQ